MIDVRDLSVTFPGGVRALQRIDLTFEPGHFTVLLGPSGAGKSTLLRCLNGLVTPSSGRVVAETSGDLSDRSALRRHRRQTAMVFQQHQLIGRLSALNNVAMGRLGFHSTWRTLFGLPSADLEIALEALDRVGLLDQALRRVDQLSGGQQQRVGIARALAQQPSVILADEPVASLDPGTARRVLSLLERICRDGNISAIVSLHQVELAKEFADRIVGIAAGTVVFDGAVEALSDRHIDAIYGDRTDRPQPATDKSELKPRTPQQAALAME